MNKQEFKSYRAEVKAASNGDAGVVEAIVSVFGNIDLGGDRVVQGAFAKSLDRWKNSGDPLPFIWSHEWDNPEAHIGFVEEAEERPEGLWVRARVDIDRPFAEQVFHLMKTRRVTQFSFGYTVEDSEMVKDADGTPVRELKEVDVFEVGPTLLGMNPATQLLQAASALRDLKAGRVLSGKNEDKIRAAHIALGEVLATMPEEDGTKSRSIKATADEVAEGVFVEWDADGETRRGRIEHVMTEGILGVPESEFQLEASPENPALLVRVFEETEEGWQETEMLVGYRADAVRVIEPLKGVKSLEKKALEVPGYVAENAQRGLEYYEQGLAGDGLEEQTVADARQMANGEVSEEKIRKIGPWIDRHIVDLDASQNSDPEDPNYPGPGLVAMLLWGAGPDKDGAMQTRNWARDEAARLDEENKSSEPKEDSETASRDKDATIIPEKVLDLLVRTRHSEE